MKDLDQQLETLRAKHRATARYTIYLNHRFPSEHEFILKRGLTYDEVWDKRKKLNMERPFKGISSAIFGIELEGGKTRLSHRPLHTCPDCADLLERFNVAFSGIGQDFEVFSESRHS